MQRGNYQKKLERMREYAKTPHAKALKKITQARWMAKRKAETQATRKLKVNPQPLIQAFALWR
jgi:uncharacterized protein YecT (DUF1311 family)